MKCSIPKTCFQRIPDVVHGDVHGNQTSEALIASSQIAYKQNDYKYTHDV